MYLPQRAKKHLAPENARERLIYDLGRTDERRYQFRLWRLQGIILLIITMGVFL